MSSCWPFALTAEECGFDAFFRSDHYLKMGAPSGTRLGSPMLG